MFVLIEGMPVTLFVSLNSLRPEELLRDEPAILSQATTLWQIRNQIQERLGEMLRLNCRFVSSRICLPHQQRGLMRAQEFLKHRDVAADDRFSISAGFHEDQSERFTL